MIRKAWYAVCSSEQDIKEPHKFTVHGADYLVYRDETGLLHAFDAYCPHRGCDLSLGTTENQEIICPFHGWRFDKEGRCTFIPANRSQINIPPKAFLSPYPICEKSGLIWIYTIPKVDLENVSELTLFPELDEGWRYVPFHTAWNANFTRAVESVLDVSHLPFVHPETAGQGISPVVDGPEYSVSANRIQIHPTPFVSSHPMEPTHPPEEIEERTEIELIFPNNWIIRTPIGSGNWMCTFLTFTPRGDQSIDIFGIALRNFDLDSDFLDDFHIQHTTFVMGQDQGIIESLKPVVATFDLQREAHVPSDGPTIRYRMMLREALEKEKTLTEHRDNGGLA